MKRIVLSVFLAAAVLFFHSASPITEADNTYFNLAGGNLSQNWSTTTLITVNDNWSGVPSIEGFRGDGLTAVDGTDPQTLLLNDGMPTIDVNANQTAPNTLTTGGVAEFEITDPSIAFQGSGTADAPYVQIYLNTTGRQNVQVSYNLRDLDGSTDNAVQPVALHYRVGTTGSFTNVPAGYVADATTGPSSATLVTPVSVTLPAAVNNQAQVQIRIMTANATGNDEWVGIDDISIQSVLLPFVVNDTGDAADAVPGDGACETAAAGICTLRAAIGESNALAGTNSITFSALFSTPQTITLTSGTEIEINSALTITGPGANLLTVDGGAGSNRIFYSNAAVATISGVTMTSGGGSGTASNGTGGAIFASGGTLVLDGVHVTGNSSAGALGGGAYFFGGTSNQIINSTFSANSSAGTCGGFLVESGTLAITNSTISGNTATLGGAGFCNNAGVVTTLRGVTIFNNTAGGGAAGGGISISGSTLNLGSTIVAGNSAGSNPDISFGGVITTAGYNLIGINTSVEAAFPQGNPNVNNDIVGTAASPVDPLVGPLANYAGPTPTHALRPSPVSPAIDKGFAFGATTDQRGFARTFDDPGIAPAPGGDNTDIGAYERLSPTAANTSISGRVTTAGGNGIKGAAITLSSGSGQQQKVRVLTSTFGYYRFEGLQVGETYVLTVGAKRYTFLNPSIVVSLNDEVSDADFTAMQ